jgi:hypothetical protein
MNDHDLKKILEYIDQALAVCRRNEGRLSALEVSAKSMLGAVRSEVTTQLARRMAEVGSGDDLGLH